MAFGINSYQSYFEMLPPSSDSCKSSIWQTCHWLNISTGRNNQHGRFFPPSEMVYSYQESENRGIKKKKKTEKRKENTSLWFNVKVRGINDLN